MSKQSSVDFILNAFNLLSDSDFKAWMLNNYDEVKAMHKEEITSAHLCGQNSNEDIEDQQTEIEYYNAIFGDEEVL